MTSTIGSPVAPLNDRRKRDGLVVAGLVIILAFAVVGVISAALFLGGRFTSASPARTYHPASTTAARTQATQIVGAAHAAGAVLIARKTSRAKHEAAAIVAHAKRRAASILSHARAAAMPPAAISAAPPTASAPSANASTASGQSSNSSGGTSSTAALGGSGTSRASSSSGDASSSPPSATANLAGLPASWYVVAYNASFGSGPGSAGSITVTNRGAKSFAGTVRVAYARGGTATAAFAGLSPGQTVVLPLDGPKYPGGGFSISVLV